jgi:hypothetical protein
MCPSVAGAVGDVAWSVIVAASCAGEVVASAALSVSGDVVIVILWVRT